MSVMVRGSSLVHLPDLVGELGGDASRLLHAVQIAPSEVGRHDVFLALPKVAAAVEFAAVLTDTPDFGRRLATRQGIDILGPVGVAARTAATVRDALAVFEQYVAAYSPGVGVRVRDVDNPELVFFEFALLDPDLPTVVRQSVELSLGVILRVLRSLLGSGYRPEAVHLPHGALTRASDYRRYFGCPARFSEPAAGFTMKRGDLEHPLRRDPLDHEALVRYLGTITERGLGTRRSVELLVNQLLPTGTCTLTTVADRLSLHPKALQRRLTDEETTFAAIVDELRRRRAHQLLTDTEISVSQLATELGYAEPSVLTRASRRWFGCPPAAYRRNGGSAAPARSTTEAGPRALFAQ